MPSPRSYRSKIEVLRDLLRAAQAPAPKTRIIGAANLNPVSFGKYLRICTDHDLITSVAGGYVATPRASPLLQAIDGLILKAGELETAYLTLERSASSNHGPNGGPAKPFRQVLRHAWNGIALVAADPDNDRKAHHHEGGRNSRATVSRTGRRRLAVGGSPAASRSRRSSGRPVRRRGGRPRTPRTMAVSRRSSR